VFGTARLGLDSLLRLALATRISVNWTVVTWLYCSAIGRGAGSTYREREPRPRSDCQTLHGKPCMAEQPPIRSLVEAPGSNPKLEAGARTSPGCGRRITVPESQKSGLSQKCGGFLQEKGTLMSLWRIAEHHSIRQGEKFPRVWGVVPIILRPAYLCRSRSARPSGFFILYIRHNMRILSVTDPTTR